MKRGIFAIFCCFAEYLRSILRFIYSCWCSKVLSIKFILCVRGYLYFIIRLNCYQALPGYLSPGHLPISLTNSKPIYSTFDINLNQFGHFIVPLFILKFHQVGWAQLAIGIHFIKSVTIYHCVTPKTMYSIPNNDHIQLSFKPSFSHKPTDPKG